MAEESPSPADSENSASSLPVQKDQVNAELKELSHDLNIASQALGKIVEIV